MSFQTLQNNVSDGKIGGMTNTHDIVIPRSELPEVVVTNHGNAYSFILKDEVKNPTTRYKALEYLALDDAIKGHAAALEAEKGEKKLREEAAAFQKKFYPANYAGLSDINEAYWMKVARIARELYGK